MVFKADLSCLADMQRDENDINKQMRVSITLCRGVMSKVWTKLCGFWPTESKDSSRDTVDLPAPLTLRSCLLHVGKEEGQNNVST